ncbi:hypothetical protein TNIN_314261 [Trichonephila inaurata madagascariensis]|uniref:Uncharacterized protein n=1 Tax=Trichonephila inaurata madagascariensis TaxID=2747483 RepID=A0A8X6WW96_9ARAC|nr:hypothetical protein TNIN_314261 [Trichonephila inaurata madagascariensis]
MVKRMDRSERYTYCFDDKSNRHGYALPHYTNLQCMKRLASAFQDYLNTPFERSTFSCLIVCNCIRALLCFMSTQSIYCSVCCKSSFFDYSIMIFTPNGDFNAVCIEVNDMLFRQ